MKKDQIYINHWLQLKPYTNETNIDLYYLNICNTIYAKIDIGEKIVLLSYISQDDLKMLTCFIVSYFEDVISKIGFWETFQQQYKSQNNKQLPFYAIANQDYNEGDINIQDISFLIWYYINTIQKEHSISPFNKFILDISLSAMEVFEEEYEYVPENDKLKTCYTLAKNVDFYDVREFIQKVIFSGFLFYPDINQRHDLELEELLLEKKDEEEYMKLSYIREFRETYTFNKKSSLLAMSASEWGYHFLKNTHQKTQGAETISKRVVGFFLYKNQDKNLIYLEHIASGKSFELTKKSFDDYNNLKEDEILYIGLVKWEGYWWFSGNYYKQEFNADLILDQKNSAVDRASVNFLNPTEYTQSFLEDQKKTFLKLNKGSLTITLPENKVDDFIQSFITHHNDTLKLSKEEIKESEERIKKEGFFHEEFSNQEEDQNFIDVNEKVVLFFNPSSGIEIFYGLETIFPNETHNSNLLEITKSDIISLLFSPEYSPELIHYFIKKFKNKVSILKESPLKEYIAELDFLLQFSKINHYEEQNRITFIGNS
ncbi:hypothetical protein IMCC3317_26470 [Kordia antarctica]|uniref:DUF3843 family protein n=1 Tax=Kordia antarctica TaxID=1218801 RepID=A0A7L4ZKM7_9FLAO|nr:DUF3843 family protein [Kordia antarctica]QHI37268.1 hypothetical protein IMCC3317_26470 [Kordia antarctica]